ncbi:hypothetical protein [Gloeothece verrucosa]|uniref:Uncharacterized protein n=1 Tax=Gloeothece verrucosa (strain PCC 7822) TaxID=497965 RepID=E0UFP3_GLOV7|nr:hypothetical protein [Gloeothece verrucosa]ADN13154.1 hypothetical protein Cyan7822_1147 [Gloeothece verrucosa PCC 7822]
MTKQDILEALKQMSNLERLEIIEFTSQLMQEEEINKKSENLEVAQGVTAKLKSNSAQAKALKRIAHKIGGECEFLTADDEWIVVDEVGQEIDLDALKEKFKQRGYKSKISATQTSTSGN